MRKLAVCAVFGADVCEIHEVANRSFFIYFTVFSAHFTVKVREMIKRGCRGAPKYDRLVLSDCRFALGLSSARFVQERVAIWPIK